MNIIDAIPSSLLFYISSAYIGIVEIRRLCQTCVRANLACNHVRLEAPHLCFDELPLLVRESIVIAGTDKHTRWRAFGSSSSFFDVAKTESSLIRNETSHGGVVVIDFSAFMHMCSLSTPKDLSEFLLQSNACHQLAREEIAGLQFAYLYPNTPSLALTCCLLCGIFGLLLWCLISAVY